jgi:hypothetical protein
VTTLWEFAHIIRPLQSEDTLSSFCIFLLVLTWVQSMDDRPSALG